MVVVKNDLHIIIIIFIVIIVNCCAFLFCCCAWEKIGRKKKEVQNKLVCITYMCARDMLLLMWFYKKGNN